MKNLTLDRLNEAVSYCEASGDFFVKSFRKGTRGAGRKAGSVQRGYVYLCIDYRSYRAHHLVWFLKTGEWPKLDIDHINGISTDNRFENLREVSRSINCRNQGLKPSNKSGFSGIRFRDGSWNVQIRIDGKQKHVGTFKSRDVAINAAREFRKQHGYTDRHSVDTAKHPVD